MCKAFSCVVLKSGKVIWKVGVDNHEKLKNGVRKEDDNPNNLVDVEITPDEGYLHPEGKWTLKFDNKSELAPEWWKASHEKHVWEAQKNWKKRIYSKINLQEALNPINPLLLLEVNKVTPQQIVLLKKWNSVWDSVGDSVWDSVWDSVRDSVWNSVWDSVRASVWDSIRAYVGDSVWDSVGNSVWDSVGNSVWDSVGNSVGDSVENSVRDSIRAYTGSFFLLDRKSWKCTAKIKTKGYPFQPAVDLWKQGLVPSYDGKTWRLHTGKKANVVYEWIPKKEED